MPIYDSDSDSDLQAPPGLMVSLERTLSALLGKGKVADILLWRDKYASAATLIALSVIWYLFEVVEYPFITLLCHLLIASMIILCLWSNGAPLFKWNPPTSRDVKLSESTCRSFFQKLNHFLLRLYGISSGKDIKTFLLTVAGLWILSSFGSLCDSTLTLFYIVFVCLSTIPAMCMKYEKEVNTSAGRMNRGMKNLATRFNSTVLEKIPRGPKKNKRSY